MRSKDEGESLPTRLSKPPFHIPHQQPTNLTSSHYSGAGNYYSPSTLIRSGIFASTHANGEEPGNSLNPLKKTVTAAGVPVSNSGAYQGRGGAGNYLSSASAVAKEEEEMRRREETMRIKAEKDVELGLLKPSRAHLTGREEEGDRAALEEIALR